MDNLNETNEENDKAEKENVKKAFSKSTTHFNFRRTRVLPSGYGKTNNILDLFHQLQKRFDYTELEPEEKKKKTIRPYKELENINSNVRMDEMKGLNPIRKEDFIIIQKKHNYMKHNHLDRINSEYLQQSYNLLSRCKSKSEYTRLKKELEKKDLNKRSSVYLTHLKKNSYKELDLDELIKEDEDIYFNNVYNEGRKAHLVEVDPAFCKSQQYMDVLYTVDSEESNVEVYDRKRLYFYQYLKEKSMFQTGFEHKKKCFTVDRNKTKTTSFDYNNKKNQMTYMLDKQLKDSKKQVALFSDLKLKNDLKDEKTKKFCKTFLNLCVHKLNDDKERIKKLNEESKKIEITQKKQISLIHNLPVIGKEEHKLNIDPRTFKMIKDKKIKFKPSDLKVNV